MKQSVKIVLGVLMVAALAFAGYWLGDRRGRMQAATDLAAPQPAQGAAGSSADPGGRKPLYYHDPMNPQHKFDKPGRSPFMNMDLVPVYADATGGDASGVNVSPRVAQNLGIRTAAVETSEFARDLRTVGYVAADERRIVQVQSRLAGFIEKLNVRAVNDPVRKGQILAEVYSPEWAGAQQEFLFARRLGDAALLGAARERLLLFGLPEEEVRRIEAAGKPIRRFSLVAPTSGVLSELAVREGQAISVGMPAFTITDLSSVWVNVEVPENQSGFLREGVRAQAAFPTLPGASHDGRVEYIYPKLDTQTRTLRARVSLANPHGELKPGMLAEVTLVAAARKGLAVPTEAVIQTGTRSVVIVAEGERFRPETVEVGLEMDGKTEILKGLKQGERVVASGQFLIDSEASLKSALSRLGAGEPEATGGAKPATGIKHAGTGRVLAIDAKAGSVELAHGPLPSLKWPSMNMTFMAEDKAAIATLAPGDMVEFEVKGEPDKDGNYTITRIVKKKPGESK
jgi:Cu(I)/Ag(I) efflux system membrane fusion protein